MKAEKLKKLIVENPELKVVTMVNYEVCVSDDHAYWLGSSLNAEIVEMYVYEERVYHENGHEELKEVIYDKLHDEFKDDEKALDELSRIEIEKLIDVRITEMIKKKEIEYLGKVICIYVDS